MFYHLNILSLSDSCNKLFKYDKKKREYVADVASVPVGFITYNPLTGLAYKRITRETNTFSDFIPLNPNTLEPLE